MKNEKIYIRISEAEKENLVAVAEKRDVPVSQIVREAVREKIADLTEIKETEEGAALAK